MNIRRTRKNLSKISTYLEALTHKYDIISSSETWLKESEIDVYNIHDAIPRIYAYRCGVSLYLRNTFSYGVREELSSRNGCCECLFIDIANDVTHVLIAIVYRRPNTDLETFTELISNTLDIVKTDKHTCYLLGGLSINMMCTKQQISYISLFQWIFPLIKRPTRVTAETATIIDHIYIQMIWMPTERWYRGS